MITSNIRNKISLLFALLLFLYGCSENVTPDINTGIPIVNEILADEQTHVIDLNVEPTHIITVTSHHWITASDSLPKPMLLTLWDDNVIIAESSKLNIHVYSKDGELIQVLGGTGEGPGEYAHISGFMHGGDQLTVFDAKALRFTFYDKNLGLNDTKVTRHLPESNLLINGDTYFKRIQNKDPELSLVNFVTDEIVEQFDFPKVVPLGFRPGTFNRAYISKDFFSDQSLIVGYKHIPVFFLYDSKLNRKDAYYLKHIDDEVRFPVEIKPRDGESERSSVLYHLMQPVGNKHVLLHRGEILYLINLDKSGFPLASIHFKYPDSMDRKRFLIRDITLGGDMMYVLDSYYDMVYRFDLSEIFESTWDQIQN